MSDPELERKIAACNDPELIREIVKNHYESNGLIRRERGNDYGMQFIAQPPSGDQPLPATNFKYEHIYRYAPDSGKRALVLRANTEEDLQALISQIEHRQ